MAFLKLLPEFVAVLTELTAYGVLSQFSDSILHNSNKRRFLEGDVAVFKIHNPSSQVIFKHRAISVLHDQMHIPLCLIFQLVRPFSKRSQSVNLNVTNQFTKVLVEGSLSWSICVMAGIAQSLALCITTKKKRNQINEYEFKSPYGCKVFFIAQVFVTLA